MPTVEALNNKIEAVEAQITKVESKINEANAELRKIQQQHDSSPTDALALALKYQRRLVTDLRQEKADLRQEEADLRQEEADLRQLEIIRGQSTSEDAGASNVGKAEEKWLAGSPSSNETMTTLEIAVVEEEGPIFWDLPNADLTAAETFANFCKAIPRSHGSKAARTRFLFSESNSYSLAASILPTWSQLSSNHATTTAESIFGMTFSMMPYCMQCRPDLGVRCSTRRSPGFNAELKTMGNEGLFDGASTYVALDMLRSFFTDWTPGASQPSKENLSLFYMRPPLGYALCGAPPVGWVVVMELVGRLFVSAYSKPFFLGSEEHKSVISRLDAPDFEEPLDLGSVLANSAMWKSKNTPSISPSGGGLVKYSKQPVGGLFYKVKTWSAVRPEFQKRCAAAYKAYGAARACDPAPEALVEASLLFGCGKIAVQMPFLRGRHPTDVELSSPDAANALCVGLAAALAWLLAHDLLYTDLRPPNVLVLEQGEVRLVDYDDMRVVAGLGREVEAGGVTVIDFDSGETNFVRLYPGVRQALVAAIEAGKMRNMRRRVGLDAGAGPE